MKKTKTAMKCTKIKNAGGKRAKVLLFIVQYAMICDVLVVVVVVSYFLQNLEFGHFSLFEQREMTKFKILQKIGAHDSNGGRRSPAVISAPIDLDRRPHYFTRSGYSFKKYCPEFPKNWMRTGNYDHMISVSVELYH